MLAHFSIQPNQPARSCGSFSSLLARSPQALFVIYRQEHGYLTRLVSLPHQRGPAQSKIPMTSLIESPRPWARLPNILRSKRSPLFQSSRMGAKPEEVRDTATPRIIPCHRSARIRVGQNRGNRANQSGRRVRRWQRGRGRSSGSCRLFMSSVTSYCHSIKRGHTFMGRCVSKFLFVPRGGGPASRLGKRFGICFESARGSLGSRSLFHRTCYGIRLRRICWTTEPTS